jgi:hypothetical protein
MNAISPPFTPGAPPRGAFGQSGGAGSSLKWAALQDAANVVAGLAGLEPERGTPEVRNFPALMRDAAPWCREMAERAIDEMTAVMAPGIAALLGVTAGGANPRAPALALWREFTQARAAVLALLPPTSSRGPRHGA